ALPADVPVAAVDHGAGGLAPLTPITAGDRERQARLLHQLRGELDRRRGGATGSPVVLVIDGVGSFRAAFDDVAGMDVLDDLARLVADGTAVGIRLVLVGSGLPLALAAAIRQQWVAADGGPPGRFVDGPTGRRFQ